MIITEKLKRIEKPWGYEEIWAETKDYVGKILTISAGKRLSLQYHNEKEETVYVLQGALRVWESKDENDFVDIPPGGVYHVKPGQIHRFGAIPLYPRHADTKIVEVSTNYLDDVIRLSDDFNR